MISCLFLASVLAHTAKKCLFDDCNVTFFGFMPKKKQELEGKYTYFTVLWVDNEESVGMNECYMWMRAHVSDRGILYLFTVRFLLFKHFFLPNRLLQGMFCIIPQNY